MHTAPAAPPETDFNWTAAFVAIFTMGTYAWNLYGQISVRLMLVLFERLGMAQPVAWLSQFKPTAPSI